MKFNTKEAAKYLESIGTPFSRKTLEVWRSQGYGPEYIKIKGKVFYKKSALDRFSDGTTYETIDSRTV